MNNNKNIIYLANERFRRAVDNVSTRFNHLPGVWKRFVLVICGLAAAGVCVTIIARALLGESTIVLP